MLKTANETWHKSAFDRMAGWTGWFWESSWHVIILSAFRSQLPVVFLGFRVVERQGQQREPAICKVRIATRRAGWRPFDGPPGWPPNDVDLAARNAEDARTEPAPHR